ncbi:MAG: Hfq-like protein [Terriglobales bacterium]
MPARPAGEPDTLANRKLIRPSLAGLREQLAKAPVAAIAPVRAPKKPVPPEQTNAEVFYYVKQMQAKTPVVLVLQDGERIRGTIEWYDRHCLKIHRHGEPNLLIYKANVKYIYKLEEEAEAGSAAGANPDPPDVP